MRERAGRAGFGSGKRGYGKLNDAPGPGAYTSPNKNGGPAYRMGGRHDRKQGPDVPGPGAYDSSLNPVKERALGGKIGGAARRGPGGNSDAPGPGSYDYKDGPKGGARWGKEARGKGNINDAPGPG